MKEYKVTEHIHMQHIPGRCVKFKNFSGEEQPKNPKGKRNFVIEIMDEAFAEKLIADGWNVKPPREKDGVVYPHQLTVQVGYKVDSLKPKVRKDQGTNRVFLTEATIGDLDQDDIVEIRDIEIRPYNWEVSLPTGTATGVTAYLYKMKVEVETDMFSDDADDNLPFD